MVYRYYGISQRWYAEAEGQTILSVGHRLANIVARALMGDALYPWDQVLRRLETRFPASSTNKRHSVIYLVSTLSTGLLAAWILLESRRQ